MCVARITLKNSILCFIVSLYTVRLWYCMNSYAFSLQCSQSTLILYLCTALSDMYWCLASCLNLLLLSGVSWATLVPWAWAMLILRCWAKCRRYNRAWPPLYDSIMIRPIVNRGMVAFDKKRHIYMHLQLHAVCSCTEVRCSEYIIEGGLGGVLVAG